MKYSCRYGGLENEIPNSKNLFVGLLSWPVFAPVEREPCPAGWFREPSEDVIITMPEHRPEVEVVVNCPVRCSTDLQAVPSWTPTIEDISDGGSKRCVGRRGHCTVCKTEETSGRSRLVLIIRAN
jgi:hypothetical protein